MSRGHTVTQIRYAGTNMKYDLDTNVTVLTLKIDDSGYPCRRYINRKGEFDIQNREMNLVAQAFYLNIKPKFLPSVGSDNLE